MYEMNKIKSNFLIFQKKLSEVLLVFLKYLFLFIFAFFLILPFYWMLNIALQKESSTISYFPINFTFENFIGFFKSSRLEFFPLFLKLLVLFWFLLCWGVLFLLLQLLL